MKDEDKE